jgi:hypothetical protein
VPIAAVAAQWPVQLLQDDAEAFQLSLVAQLAAYDNVSPRTSQLSPVFAVLAYTAFWPSI